MLPSRVQAVIDDVLPTIKALAEGRHAVSLGGSYGRGNFDQYSDLDFRLFCDRVPHESDTRAQEQLTAAIQRWSEQSIRIDGCWIRLIQDVSAQLDQWCRGVVAPEDRVWTVWGYHLPADIYHQAIVDDPFGIIAGWQEQLRQYPPLLKQALVKKHLTSVRYWRDDYHYRHKVQRKDVIFLAGLTMKIVHNLIQILFALNETYYVGDGNNLAVIRQFIHVPDDFVIKVEAVLYPRHEDGMLEQQRSTLIQLIDEIEALVTQLGAQG